jgi:hypothetical protein
LVGFDFDESEDFDESVDPLPEDLSPAALAGAPSDLADESDLAAADLLASLAALAAFRVSVW